MKRYLPYLAGLGIALAWGLSFLFTKGVLDYLSPFHLLGLRFAAAFLTMFILKALNLIRISLTGGDYIRLLPLAIFQPILYFSAETAGIMLTSASYAAMMIASIPIFVAILGTVCSNDDCLHPYICSNFRNSNAERTSKPDAVSIYLGLRSRRGLYYYHG